MDYLLGFLVAIGMFLFFRIIAPKMISKDLGNSIRYSQTHIHEIIKYNIPESMFSPIKKPTQSDNCEKLMNVKVLFIDKEAYWIKENALFIADQEDGIVKEDTARRVDTMGMNGVQLEKVMYIVDILNEGNENDRGYTGNKGF
jgi:hypothetical protein